MAFHLHGSLRELTEWRAVKFLGLATLGLVACGSPPEDVSSPVLPALGLHQPAGAERDCVRFFEKAADRSRFHHWECSRRSPPKPPADPGPWTEDRVILTTAGLVKQVERTWAVPDTSGWLATADSIGTSLLKRGAREVRCDHAARTRTGMITWYLDSVFVMMQAYPIPFGGAHAGMPIRFELRLVGAPRGGQTCIPVVPGSSSRSREIRS